MIGLIILLVVAIVIFLKRKEHINENGIISSEGSANTTLSTLKNGELSIPIELLPATTIINDLSLYEITDQTVLSRISNTLPAIAETATRTVTNNALKNVGDVYKAILPAGESLVKSKDMAEAVRGFSRGAKGIRSHANLIKVDITKTTAIANSVANVMNVGSLVVGQYYMTEINDRLETMSKNINKISDFQDREFKSRILSLIARVSVISKFSAEILENNEQRKIKLASLDDLNGIATELLGQVNETIAGIVSDYPNPDYKEYQEKVDEFTVLVEYQNVLISVLEEIGKLAYLLGKGDVSSDMCYMLFNKYYEMSVGVRNDLERWHDKQVEQHGIDLEMNRKTKSGVEGFFAAIPAKIIDDKWKYKELKNGLARKISKQFQTDIKSLNAPREVYTEDVEIIIKDGKYFYLHDTPPSDNDDK